MIECLSLLFAVEFAARKSSKEFIWSVISKSSQDKVAFFLAILTGWTISLFPLEQEINSVWQKLLFLVVGWILAILIVFFLGTKNLRARLLPRIFSGHYVEHT